MTNADQGRGAKRVTAAPFRLGGAEWRLPAPRPRSTPNLHTRTCSVAQPVYSLNGQAFAPLYGGWRCINTPLRRMPIRNTLHDASGNVAASCDSRVDIDFNAVIASGFDPALVAGQQVCLQLLVRDGSFANGVNLTPGIEFTIAP